MTHLKKILYTAHVKAIPIPIFFSKVIDLTIVKQKDKQVFPGHKNKEMLPQDDI